MGSSDGFLVSRDAGATWARMPSQTYPDTWSADGRRWVGRSWFTNSTGSSLTGGISTYQSALSPRIIINPTQFGLTLSWLVPSSTVSLQQSLDVSSANWEMVSNTPYLNLSNLQNEVVLPTDGNRGFYRLSEP